MKKLSLLVVVLLSIACGVKAQSTGVDNFYVEISTPKEDAFNRNVNQGGNIEMKLVFEVVDIQNIATIHIEVMDSLGGTVAFSRTLEKVQTSGEYWLKFQKQLTNKVWGGKYVYYNLPQIIPSDIYKYRYCKVWATNTQGISTTVKTFNI